MAALAEHPRAIGIFELNTVMIENLAVVRRAGDLRATHSKRADRMVAFEPIDDVQIVNVLLDDVIPANPNKIVPVAHLILHFRECALKLGLQIVPAMGPGPRSVPIGPGGDELADRAILESLQ